MHSPLASNLGAQLALLLQHIALECAPVTHRAEQSKQSQLAANQMLSHSLPGNEPASGPLRTISGESSLEAMGAGQMQMAVKLDLYKKELSWLEWLRKERETGLLTMCMNPLKSLGDLQRLLV